LLDPSGRTYLPSYTLALLQSGSKGGEREKREKKPGGPAVFFLNCRGRRKKKKKKKSTSRFRPLRQDKTGAVQLSPLQSEREGKRKKKKRKEKGGRGGKDLADHLAATLADKKERKMKLSYSQKHPLRGPERRKKRKDGAVLLYMRKRKGRLGPPRRKGKKKCGQGRLPYRETRGPPPRPHLLRHRRVKKRRRERGKEKKAQSASSFVLSREGISPSNLYLLQ